MKRTFGTLLLLVVALSCRAQLTIPMGGTSPSSDDGHKTTHFTSRILTGTVLDKSDKPIANAVVYLKNLHTQDITTHLSEEHEDAGHEELHFPDCRHLSFS